MDIQVAAKKIINYVTSRRSSKMSQMLTNTGKGMQRRHIQSNGQRDRPWQIPEGRHSSGNDGLPVMESCCLSTMKAETDTDRTRAAESMRMGN